MAQRMKWWLKERRNPQTGTYWVMCGQITKTKAKQWENTLYGYNKMHSFDTEAEYLAKIAALEAQGVEVR